MINNRRSGKLSRRRAEPRAIEQFVLAVGMFVSGLVIYFWITGL